MKIGGAFPFARPQDGASQVVHRGKSFAQLLEDGESAKSITDHRALSFSESGLFGRRFAAGRASAAPHAPGDHPGSITKQALPVPGEVETPADINTDAQSGRSLEAEQSGAPSRTEASHAEEAVPASVSEPAVVNSVTSSAQSADPSDLSFFVDPLRRVLKNRSTSGTGPRLMLRGSSHAVIVILDGLSIPEDDRLEVEAIIQRVAREYGVTVAGIVVIPKISAGGNQRGGGQ